MKEKVNTSVALTVETMPVSAGVKLTSDVRKQLFILIEREFSNKDSLYHQIQEAEKEKIIKAYQDKVGFNKAKAKLLSISAERRKLDEKYAQAENAIYDVGLDLDGFPAPSKIYKDGHLIENPTAKELNEKLEIVNNNAPTENMKAKLLTRLTLATTVGEANVIMRQVLGNGMIPSLRREDITTE